MPDIPLPESLGLVTQWFDLPRLRLHAAAAGPETGPLLLLLHGFPEFWYSWRKVIPSLASAGFRVVALDQRGYNLSTKTPPYDILTLVEDVLSLIQSFGSEKVFVCGHDWGGVVAWALAGLHPEKVNKLAILNAPHPEPFGHILSAAALRRGSLRQILKSWYIFYFQIPWLPEWLFQRRGFAALRQMLLSSSQPGTFSPEELDNYSAAWEQPGALSASIGWYRAMARQTLRNRLQTAPHGIPRVSVPTLILWGEKDVALSVDVAEESLKWTDHGRLVRIPEATHWVHEDMPDVVAKYLLDHFIH